MTKDGDLSLELSGYKIGMSVKIKDRTKTMLLREWNVNFGPIQRQKKKEDTK